MHITNITENNTHELLQQAKKGHVDSFRAQFKQLILMLIKKSRKFALERVQKKILSDEKRALLLNDFIFISISRLFPLFLFGCCCVYGLSIDGAMCIRTSHFYDLFFSLQLLSSSDESKNNFQLFYGKCMWRNFHFLTANREWVSSTT